MTWKPDDIRQVARDLESWCRRTDVFPATALVGHAIQIAKEAADFYEAWDAFIAASRG